MTHSDKITELLRALVSNYVDRPEELVLNNQESSDGACYFALQGALGDEGKLIGQRGSHVRALTFLIELMGSAQRRPWTFRLVTKGSPQRRVENEPRDVVTHDPRPHRDLLCRILEAIGCSVFGVEVGPGNGARHSLTFIFTVRIPVSAELERIKSAIHADGRKDDDLTIANAIETLFRAIAKKSGVRYQIIFTT